MAIKLAEFKYEPMPVASGCFSYSYLRASMEFNLAALLAG